MRKTMKVIQTADTLSVKMNMMMNTRKMVSARDSMVSRYLRASRAGRTS
jgi:hypothetical protein